MIQDPPFLKPNPTEADKARAEDLIRQGYHQISSKYRMVARLPEGKTAIDALAEVAPDLVAGWIANLERMAHDHYLRVYAPRAGKHVIELTPEEFAAYRLAGGGPK